MDVARLQRVAARIAAAPTEFDMDDFVCGTQCCIGGHAALDAGMIRLRSEKGPDMRWYEITDPHFDTERHTATEIFRMALDLTHQQADRLFYIQHWPKLYLDEYQATYQGKPTRETAKTRALIAKRRIEHFIRTKGDQ